MTVTMLFTIICPGAGLLIGYYCLSDRNFDWRSAAFCLALFMASLAYCLNVTNGDDLPRYLDFVDRMAGCTFSEAISSKMKGESDIWLFSVICWAIGKTGDYHLLPGLSTFFVYFIGFYITGRIGEDLRATPRRILEYYAFIVITSQFWGIANNVRNIFAFSVVGYAIFRDVYEKKRDIKTILLYLLPMYIHPSASVAILCRFVILLTGRLKIVSLAICFILNPLITAMYRFTSGLSGSNGVIVLLRSVTKKAYEYFNDTGSAWGLAVKNSGSQRLQKILYIGIAILMTILAYRTTNYLKEKMRLRKISSRDRDVYRRVCIMVDFAFVMGLLTISCIPMLMPEYWRFCAVLILFGGPIYFVQEMVEKDKSIDADNVVHYGSPMMIRVISVAMLGCCFLWGRDVFNGSQWLELFYRPLTCSPITALVMTIIQKIS